MIRLKTEAELQKEFPDEWRHKGPGWSGVMLSAMGKEFRESCFPNKWQINTKVEGSFSFALPDVGYCLWCTWMFDFSKCTWFTKEDSLYKIGDWVSIKSNAHLGQIINIVGGVHVICSPNDRVYHLTKSEFKSSNGEKYELTRFDFAEGDIVTLCFASNKDLIPYMNTNFKCEIAFNILGRFKSLNDGKEFDTDLLNFKKFYTPSTTNSIKKPFKFGLGDKVIASYGSYGPDVGIIIEIDEDLKDMTYRVKTDKWIYWVHNDRIFPYEEELAPKESLSILDDKIPIPRDEKWQAPNYMGLRTDTEINVSRLPEENSISIKVDSEIHV